MHGCRLTDRGKQALARLLILYRPKKHLKQALQGQGVSATYFSDQTRTDLLQTTL